jgi:hypothetical protein
VACGDVAAEDGDVVVEVGGTGGKGFVVALDGGGEVAFAEERVGGDLFRGCFSEEGLATSEGTLVKIVGFKVRLPPQGRSGSKKVFRLLLV